MLPQVAKWQQELMGKLSIAVISRGTVDANRQKSSEHKVRHVLLQKDREVAQLYQAAGTPSAVLVRPDGTIGSPVAAGVDAIKALVAHATGSPVAPAAVPAAHTANGAPQKANGNGAHKTVEALKVGDRVPAIKAKDQTGKSVDFSQLRSRPTLLLFWNPRCGFCTQLIEDLKAWEANPPKNAPRLIIVSAEPIDETLASGFHAAIAADPDFSIGRAFGAAGTPSALLITSDGKIGSEVMPGGPAVLELAGVAAVS